MWGAWCGPRAGPYSYYGASTGWFDACWCWQDIYDQAAACGAAAGPAVRTGTYTWKRTFAGCAVTVDTSAAAGSIVYT